MSNNNNLKPAWVKGQSGNPAGRPKGSRSIKKIINDFLDAKAPSRFDNLKQDFDVTGDLTYRDVVALSLIAKATKGKMSAIKHIIDRIDGPVSVNSAEEIDEIDVRVKIYSGDMKTQEMQAAKEKLTQIISGNLDDDER